MPETTLQQQLRQIIANELAAELSSVTPDATLESLGADSLDVIEVVMELEREFSIDITDDELQQLKTVGDVEQLVAKRVNR